MGRIPCCEKDNVKRGQWTPEEDHKLSSYIAQHGTRNWRLIPKHAGLQRCGKSCRLRWTNYLRPDLKHGQFSEAEEQTIVTLHSVLGNRWAVIAAQLPGRTDNDVKNHWNTKLKKKLSGMGIDPVTHKPFSHLITEIATTLAPPQVPHLAEAALGCFKDEMLHLLTKKRIGAFQTQPHFINNPTITNTADNNTVMANYVKYEDKADETIEKIKFGLSRAIKEPNDHLHLVDKSHGNWNQSNGGECSSFLPPDVGFHYGISSLVMNEREGSPWDAGSTCTPAECRGRLSERPHVEDTEIGGETRKGSNEFNSDCSLWDLPADDLMHSMVESN